MRYFTVTIMIITSSLARAEIVINRDTWEVFWEDTDSSAFMLVSGCYACSDLAYDRVNNRLFAIDSGDFYDPNDLYEIDIASGNLTVIGQIDIPVYHYSLSHAYDGDKFIYITNWAGDFLWRYDLETGITIKGPRTNQRKIASLTFNPDDGLLYGNLYTVPVDNPAPGGTNNSYIVNAGIVSLDPADGTVLSVPIFVEVSALSISWDGDIGGTGTVNPGYHIAYSVDTNELYMQSSNAIRAVNLDTYASRFLGYNSGDSIEIPDAKTVAVDIAPWSAGNEIKTLPDSMLSVAILSSSIGNGDSMDFDATQIDPDSVRFGPAGASAEAYFVGDVDGDNDNDMLFGFRPLDAGIECVNTIYPDGRVSDLMYRSTFNQIYLEDAMILGITYSGDLFGGSDFVAPDLDDADAVCTNEYSCHP